MTGEARILACLAKDVVARPCVPESGWPDKRGGGVATVLSIDKDALSLELLSFLLQQDGFRVFTAKDAETAFEILQSNVIDLVTVETSGQHPDGLRLCQRIRQLNPWIPLIIVSERDEQDEVVKGLLSAADDYIRKPFSPHELLARVRALLRRTRLSNSVVTHEGDLAIGEITLDQHRMAAIVNGSPVALTPREFSLLRAFMEHPDRVLSRDQLMKLAWGEGFIATPKAIDVYVLRLRQKIEPRLSGDLYVRSLRGFGYVFARPTLHVALPGRAGGGKRRRSVTTSSPTKAPPDTDLQPVKQEPRPR
jgi:DNA-binding response OmpR family regulator